MALVQLLVLNGTLTFNRSRAFLAWEEECREIRRNWRAHRHESHVQGAVELRSLVFHGCRLRRFSCLCVLCSDTIAERVLHERDNGEAVTCKNFLRFNPMFHLERNYAHTTWSAVATLPCNQDFFSRHSGPERDDPLQALEALTLEDRFSEDNQREGLLPKSRSQKNKVRQKTMSLSFVLRKARA